MAKEKEVSVEEDVAVEEKPVKKSGQVAPKRQVLIVEGMSDIDILELTRDESVEIAFDPERFVKVPSEVVAEFGYETKLKYFQAKEKAERYEKGGIVSAIEKADPFGNASERRLGVRKRRGWHQTWLKPEDVDGAKEVGYRNVRKAKEGDKVGSESGEVVKITVDGKADLYAMEVPEDLYQQHLRAVSRKGLAMSKSTRDDVLKHVETYNRTARRKDARVAVVDDPNEGGFSEV